MLNSTPTKSVTKSIVKTMEMNGTLKAQQLKPKEVMERSDEEDVETQKEGKGDNVKCWIHQVHVTVRCSLVFFPPNIAANSQPKEKRSSRRHKVLSNGKVANGGLHLSNGHSRAALNSDEGPVSEQILNGHHTGEETMLPLADI